MASSKRARQDAECREHRDGPDAQARQDGWSEHKIVLNVGGRRFETTTTLLELKTTYFRGMFESAVPGSRVDDIFVDRDPDGFALLLRFMRQGAVAAVLPRNDPALCTAVLAEADFFGVDALLQAVKAKAYRNVAPTSRFSSDTELEDAEAARLFDTSVGSISEAIEAGVLPARFFARVQRTVRTLVQPQSTCWVQVGFISHESNGYDGYDEDQAHPEAYEPPYPFQPVGDGTFNADDNQFDAGEDLPMSWWSPACVRRVAYFATVELDGVAQPEPEALILLTDEDQHAWMRKAQLPDGSWPATNDSGFINPKPFLQALTHGQRMVLLSDYITSPALGQLFCPGRDCGCDDHDASHVWTKIIFASSAPVAQAYKLKPSHPGCVHPQQ